MRRFTLGLITGFFLFTEEGKEISKKFMESMNKATEEIKNSGKKIIKETMPETKKILEKMEGETNGKDERNE